MQTPILDRPATRTENVERVARAAQERATPLTDTTLDTLAESVADDDFVLLGEATHGTAEFYRVRAGLTARLVRDHGFDFVAVEGDWTDCYEVNRYVTGRADAEDAREVLAAFERWPTWMWANWEVVEFADWLREHNAGRAQDRAPEDRVGFYGMDVYSLFESMHAVVDYLADVDPAAAERARDAYACFEPHEESGQAYARSTRIAPEDCEEEVVDVLADLVRAARRYEDDDPDGYFAAEQNALVARNAEAYYRAMVRGDESSWNVRDRHMTETLDRLREHHGPESKAVVWAHNTHVGDARATDMARRGEVNVGQLLRERHGRDDVSVVGFSTHRGRVVAGARWGAPMAEMTVPPARPGSYEDIFHRANLDAAVIDLRSATDGPLAEPRGHRAIGVVYDPDRERGNYVPTVLPERYDHVVHVDETAALHPLPVESEADAAEPPETYPWGL